MTNLFYFALGAAAGIGGYYLYDKYSVSPSDNGGQLTHGGMTTPSVLNGKIVAIPTAGSPAPSGLPPMAGVASQDGYEWGYVVGPGDSAGSIARAITGDDGRYQALLAANPQLAKTGEMGIFSGPDTWQFSTDTSIAPESRFAPGTPMLLPVPWARYIDELGTPRGGIDPFPPDPRAAPATAAVAGRAQTVAPKRLSAPKPSVQPQQAVAKVKNRAAGRGYAPYGKTVDLDQIETRRLA